MYVPSSIGKWVDGGGDSVFNIRKTLKSQLFLIIVLKEHIEDYMPLSIVIHHYLVSTDLNKQSEVVNCTNLGGISCLPGIIIHYNLFKIFLMQCWWTHFRE